MLKQIDFLVIHCSATPPSLDWGAADIRRLHQKSFKWRDIGYHYVIRRDGTVEKGRKDTVQGAHAKTWNDCSLGICLVGGVDDHQAPAFNYTDKQMEALERLVRELTVRYPDAEVLGHRDLPANRSKPDGPKVAKACPCFDAKDWWKDVVDNASPLVDKCPAHVGAINGIFWRKSSPQEV